MFWKLFIIVLTCYCHISTSLDIEGFDDSVMFAIKWSNKDGEKTVDTGDETEEIFIKTNKNEEYKCKIPLKATKEEQRSSTNENGGATPGELLEPLFQLSPCSYRLESYWTYELCHGRYLKQFHEEREGKLVKSQDYILGKWNSSLTDKFLKKSKESKEKTEESTIEYIKVESNRLPAVPVEMVDGTVCDLNGQHRTAKVFYVCDKQGKNEIYSIKETTTCNYEIIILTQLLCTHATFRPKTYFENVINCTPVNDAGQKPKRLVQLESDIRKKYTKFFDGGQLYNIESLGTSEDLQSYIGRRPSISTELPATLPLSLARDSKPVEDFLEGKYCLSGGTGYWKFELCFGKHVRQYHIDRNGEQSIILGRFIEEAHIKFLNDNPHKRLHSSKSKRKELSYLYTDGSACDKTGKPRQTEVRLQCAEKSKTLSSVSLFLIEPRTCEYELNVESPLICDIIALADNNNMVSRTKNVLTSQQEEQIND